MALLSFRPAREEDWDFIERLLRQTCTLHHSFRADLFKAEGTKFTKNAFIDTLNKKDCFVHIGTDESTARVEYLSTEIKRVPDSKIRYSRKTLFIEDLCIDAPCRRTGAGSAFMRFAEDFARENSCDALELNCWSNNAAALALYEKCGYGAERVIMEKVL